MAAPASMGVVSATRGPHKAADRTFFPSVTFIEKTPYDIIGTLPLAIPPRNAPS
jgi:hypothetical protein